MDETCGPYECSCPKRILDKPSPTDNEYAKEWRKNCRDRIEKNKKIKKDIKQLKQLPIGTKIKINNDKN